MIIKHNYHIITGGPGSGKTSLIKELQSRRYNCVSEVGRNIIREQIEMGGNALPWKDRMIYSRLMLLHSLRDYRKYIKEKDLYFFDRGIPDTYGYERLVKMPANSRLKRIANEYRYHPLVFILPPWPQIYENDLERKQDYREAVETYEMMCSVYSELGYILKEVPKTTIKERAEFLLSSIKYYNEDNFIRL